MPEPAYDYRQLRYMRIRLLAVTIVHVEQRLVYY